MVGARLYLHLSRCVNKARTEQVCANKARALLVHRREVGGEGEWSTIMITARIIVCYLILCVQVCVCVCVG